MKSVFRVEDGKIVERAIVNQVCPFQHYYSCPDPEMCDMRGCLALDPPIVGEVPAPARDHRVTCPQCGGDGAFESAPIAPNTHGRKFECSFCGGSGHIDDDEDD